MHQEAQKKGLLPKRKLSLPYTFSNLQKNWLFLFSSFDELSFRIDYSSNSELPQNWPRSENLRMFYLKNANKYLDQYNFFEQFFRATRQTQSHNSLIFPFEYLRTSQLTLRRLGLPEQQPFVTLHVRSGTGVGTRRTQNPINYIKSIRKLASLGYFVVRIGDTNMESLPPCETLIDVRDEQFHFLHPYVLKYSQLHIGTMSGPSIMAMALNTPTLFTNATSIGRNTFFGNRLTFHVPKRLFIKNRELDLREHLLNTESYSELDSRDLQKRSIVYVENSEIEICRAVTEIISYIESNILPDELLKLNNKIDLIRSETGAVSYGTFAASFFENNPHLLN
jgi:putative glycosyltransferase (TIGR04372 family)